jgi:hypothetical protein
MPRYIGISTPGRVRAYIQASRGDYFMRPGMHRLMMIDEAGF